MNHRLVTAALLVATLAAAGCNKHDNAPPLNPASPTAPTVPSPEMAGSASMPSSSATP